jgi:ribosomal subunit interface protein
MLKKFEVQGAHSNQKLKNYVNKKIGGLDRYMSRHHRESAHAEVHLKESKAKDQNKACIEVTLYLPQQTIIVKEKALNMYAAVDIAETKLKQQLKKYKDTHGNGKLHRHLFARFSRKHPLEFSEES